MQRKIGHESKTKPHSTVSIKTKLVSEKKTPREGKVLNTRIPSQISNRKSRSNDPFNTPMHQYMRSLRSDSTASVSSSFASSLLSLNTVELVRMAHIVTFTSDSGGIVTFSMPADPSSSGQNYPEYSTWTTLFNQVRVKSFKITIAPIENNSALSLNYPGLIAGCLTTLGVPTSLNSLSENADSRLYAWNIKTNPMVHSIKYNPKPVWADTTTPDPGDNIGCPGCVLGYFEGLPVSSDAFRALVEGVYEFRSRT